MDRENNTQKVRVDGVKQPVAFYNLDTIISVGYRVNSRRATQFRIWATSVLKEYMIKGFAMVQNKFHYAITGQTAAEIVYTSADRTKENMGLTTWKNAPDGRILKSDVIVAKNYLEEKQIRQLERAVTGYFDYIEDLIFCGIREKSSGEWQKKKHLPNTKNLTRPKKSPLILTRRSIGC